MKKGDLVQHVNDEHITVYELAEDVPGHFFAMPVEDLVSVRIVYAPHLMSPQNSLFDVDPLYLIPANEMLVLALAAAK